MSNNSWEAKKEFYLEFIPNLNSFNFYNAAVVDEKREDLIKAKNLLIRYMSKDLDRINKLLKERK